MRRIQLTQGQFAVVDNKNYKWLSQHNWYAWWSNCTQSFYAARMSKSENGKRIVIYMHREILELGGGDKRQTDHINHNTLDNCELNLRIVTHQQNHWNRKNPKGYYWNKRERKYHTQITLNRKKIYLGLFNTTKQAHNAYLKAKKYYHKFEFNNIK